MKFTKDKLLQIINEVNLEKVTIPAKTKRFLEKFIEAMKDDKLNRIKRAAILYKVMDGAGMTPETLMKDIQKIKKSLKKEGGPGSGPQSDDDNPFDKEPSDDDLRDIEKQFEGKLNEFNKAHFLNLIKQELDSKKGQLAYANDKIRYSGTPKWERKEWLNVAKDLKKEIKILTIRVKKVSKMEEGKLTEKSAISLNLWIKEFERLAKKNRMKPVDFVKKHISKRKGMDNEVVKNVLKHFQKNEGKLDEAGSIGGPIDLSDMESSYIAPKRDTDVSNQGVYLQKFSSKEAQKIVDGQLKNMVQDIRKVEGRVIKTWMTAAKAGKIDFFDIIRGLKTGDIRRAHTFEMDFFVKLLTRNKIVDRFRSYFKGKKGKKR